MQSRNNGHSSSHAWEQARDLCLACHQFHRPEQFLRHSASADKILESIRELPSSTCQAASYAVRIHHSTSNNRNNYSRNNPGVIETVIASAVFFGPSASFTSHARVGFAYRASPTFSCTCSGENNPPCIARRFRTALASPHDVEDARCPGIRVVGGRSTGP